SAHTSAVMAAGPAVSPTKSSGAGQPAITNNVAVTTVTAASPSTPLTNPAPANVAASSTGKPASYWALTLTFPTYCEPGTSVQPILFWNAADTDTVAI